MIVPKTGHILLQEDGAGEQFIRGVNVQGRDLRLRQDRRERDRVRRRLLDPNGQILFVNQQGDRGNLPAGPPNGGAVTYAIWGPWKSVN